MIKRAALVTALALLSAPAFAASLYLAPQTQTTAGSFTVYLGARELVNASGFDIEIVFDPDDIECTSIQFVRSALPGFSEFHRRIDNLNGSAEVVLLSAAGAGYTGTADSLLALTFMPNSGGTATIRILKSSESGYPLLIDRTLASIEAKVDTAEAIVAGWTPPLRITATKLHQNYPNPFNPKTTVVFDVAARSAVRLRIFDVNGRLIRTLVDGTVYENGRWVKEWDGTADAGVSVESGVYLCVFEAGGERMSTKLVLLR